MNKILKIFDKYPNLIVGFSTKSDGNMCLKPSGSTQIDSQTTANRKKFLNSLEISTGSVITSMLEHSNNIAMIGKNDSGKTITNVDGLITTESGVFMSLTVADCLPIFLYDPDKKVIALIHAGWRGLENNILANVINKVQETYTSKLSSIIAGIGPHIGVCHYEIKNDVLEKFKIYPEAIINSGDRYFLDIGLIAKIQLSNLGINPENIEINSECTFELSNKYFSYRRDKPKMLETMLAVFGKEATFR